MPQVIKKLLVVALRMEWSYLKRVCRFEQDTALKRLFFSKSDPQLALLQVGTGMAHAEKTFREFLTSHSCRSILHFGMCGALRAGMTPGDVFVASEIGCQDSVITVASHLTADLLAFLQKKNIRHSHGRLYTSDHILKNRDEKSFVAGRYGADAVDMESCPIAKICRGINIDYLSVRGVFDTLTEDIAALGKPYDVSGHLKAGELALNLIREPRLILKVPELQKRAKVVNANLGKTVQWYTGV